MKIPTVTLRHRFTKQEITVNESDWVLGSIPGVSLGSQYDKIAETRGDGDEAVLMGQQARILAESIIEKRRRDNLHDKMTRGSHGS